MGYNRHMKTLYHPPVGEITVDGVLYALSDPVRAQIFAELVAAECPLSCSVLLQRSDQTLPKSTLSQHFKVLRESGLVRSTRKGVEMLNTSRCQELRERFGPLIEAILNAYAIQHQDRTAANAG